jgi:hypothetical protein
VKLDRIRALRLNVDGRSGVCYGTELRVQGNYLGQLFLEKGSCTRGEDCEGLRSAIYPEIRVDHPSSISYLLFFKFQLRSFSAC